MLSVMTLINPFCSQETGSTIRLSVARRSRNRIPLHVSTSFLNILQLGELPRTSNNSTLALTHFIRVVSLILCHDRPKHRARQIEKLVDIASKLRGHNNYSALRAFVAGISNSTFEGDAAMELFRTKTPDLHKTFKSWDILFQAIRSHRAYRMALKSSKGACIPAM